MASHSIKRPLPALLAAIAALSVVLFYFYIVLKLGYNVPVNDDYDAFFRFMLDYLDSGGLSDKLGMLISQHNEHRIVFNRLITLIAYYASGELDIRLLAFLGNMGLLFLAAILYRSFGEREDKLLYFLPAVLLLFQLQYNESTFVAMAALSNFYVVVFAFLSIYLLSRNRFVPALVFAVLSTFTQGNGLFVFIAGIPLLLSQRKFREAAIWASLMALSAGVYFYDYSKPVGRPGPLSMLLERPTDVFLYFLMFIGSSLGSIAGIVAGKAVELSTSRLIALLSLFGLIPVVSFVFLSYRRYSGRNAAIFYCIIFLFITALSASLSRADFGIGQSLSSRYKFVSILFFILLYLAVIETIGKRKLKTAFFASALVLSAGFNVYSYTVHYESCAGLKNTFTTGLLRWNVDKDLSGLFYPDRTAAASVISEALGRGLFVPDFSPIESKPAAIELPPEGPSIMGSVERAVGLGRENPNGYFIEGWAFIKENRYPDSKTYLALKSEQRTYVLDTNRIKRPDVAENFESADLIDSGFSAYIPEGTLEPGEYLIGFLIVDKDGKELTYTDQPLLINP